MEQGIVVEEVETAVDPLAFKEEGQPVAVVGPHLVERDVGQLEPARSHLFRLDRFAGVLHDAEDVDFERELANEIGRLFPGCPSERVQEIASHTSQRGSGRIGRTASARALDSAAITFAVVAAARHRESEYDDLLMAGVDRSEARERVRATVDSVLKEWRTRPRMR